MHPDTAEFKDGSYRDSEVGYKEIPEGLEAEIKNIIWDYAPSELTFETANQILDKMVSMIRYGKFY